MDVLWWLVPLALALFVLVVMTVRWAVHAGHNDQGAPSGLLLATFFLNLPITVARLVWAKFEDDGLFAITAALLFALAWLAAGTWAYWSRRKRYGWAVIVMIIGFGPLGWFLRPSAEPPRTAAHG